MGPGHKSGALCSCIHLDQVNSISRKRRDTHVSHTQYYSTLPCTQSVVVVMLAQERGRYLVLLAMTITFVAIVGVSISKFENRSIGETQKTKKASEMHFPSLILCPHFITNYSTPGTKNLTEYYLNMSSVKDHVLSIHQQYITDDGLVL